MAVMGGENAHQSHGGFLYIQTTVAQVTLTTVDVTENTALASGGVIYTETAGDSGILMAGSTLRGNRAELKGGVVVVDNEGESNISIAQCSIEGNYAGTTGGVMHVERAFPFRMSIENCTASANTAVSLPLTSQLLVPAGFGGIFSVGNTMMGTIEILSSNVMDNRAEGGGGGVAYYRGEGLIKISNSTLGHNCAVNGGAVYGAAVRIEINGCNAMLNQAENAGGMIFTSDGATLVIGDCTITDGQCGTAGGAIFCTRDSQMVMQSSSLAGNQAKQGPWWLLLDLEVVQGLYSPNSGDVVLGGGICTEEGSTLHARRSVVHSNVATLFGGGGISSTDSMVELVNSTVAHNMAASSSGGGLHMARSTVVISNESYVHANNAGSRGGGIILQGNESTLLLDSSRVTENRASSEGGGLAVNHYASVAVSNRTLFEQNGGQRGGAIFVQASVFTMADSTVTENTAALDVAGVLLDGHTLAHVDRVLLQRHAGAAIGVSDLSEVLMQSSEMLDNTAHNGAGIIVDATSRVALEGCRFVRNSARNGSAVHASGDLQVTGCQFEENTALRNGQLFVDLSGRLTMSSSQFLRNVANGNGAVLYLVEPAGWNRSTTTLTKLHSEANHAELGASFLFWEHQPAAASGDTKQNVSLPPACTECPQLNNSAGYSTAEGLAAEVLRLDVRPEYTAIDGGVQMGAAGITVRAVDMFGEAVIAYDSRVFLRIQSDDTARCGLRDEVAKFAERGVVAFPNTTLAAFPGSECGVVVEAAPLENSTRVHLRLCTDGEVYDQAAQTCARCPPGSIKFNNDTRACFDCSDHDGVNCTGGDTYHVVDGYWIAPAAEQCATSGEYEGRLEECFMSMLYQCPVGAACSTSSGGNEHERSGAGLAQIPNLQLCATPDGFAGGVMCGGTIPVVCRSEYYQQALGEDCLKCASRWGILATVISVLVLIVVLVFLSITTILSYKSASNLNAFELVEHYEEAADMHSGVAELTAIAAQTAGRHFFSLLSILLGYVQVVSQIGVTWSSGAERLMSQIGVTWSSGAERLVVSQIGNIFSTDYVPAVFRAMTNSMFVFSLDLSVVFNLPCFFHYFVAVDYVSEFYLSFFQAVLLPIEIILAFFLGYAVYMGTYTMRWPNATVKEVRHVRLLTRHKAVSLTCFFLTLVHPSVSTSIMHIFNCERIWYEDADAQQSWLKMGSNIECGSGEWVGSVFIAALMIATFIIGYPLGLFLFMWDKRRFIRCEIAREDCLGHWEIMIQQGKFKPYGSSSPASPTASDKGFQVYVKIDVLVPAPAGEELREIEEKEEEVEEEEGEDERLLRKLLALPDGSTCAVTVLQVMENEKRGYFRALTMLDEDYIQQALGSAFIWPFHDRFYWYQCYEICRRLMSTGAVLVVEWLTQSEVDSVAFATLISIAALCVYLRLRPLREKDDDILMTTVLITSNVNQYLIMCIAVSDNSAEEVGIIMVIMQALLVSYALYLMTPSFLELISTAATVTGDESESKATVTGDESESKATVTGDESGSPRGTEAPIATEDIVLGSRDGELQSSQAGLNTCVSNCSSISNESEQSNTNVNMVEEAQKMGSKVVYDNRLAYMTSDMSIDSPTSPSMHISASAL
eukprot:gene2557-3310_t